MLRFISIDSYALIDHLEVEFEPGLNLITGETGSGKSILVDAVGLLVGDRASQEMIRQGQDSAAVEGLFSLPHKSPIQQLLEENGLGSEDEELIIRREISRTGNNRIFVNGHLVTLTFLLQTGAYLVDIHGQHSQQQLLHASNHLDFLDRYGSNQPLIKEVASACRKLEVLRNELKTLERSEQDRLQRLDLLRYQIEEIDRLKLVPAIDVELKRERDLLNSAERRYQAAQEVHSTLYEDDLSALSLLDQTDRSLELLATLEPSFQELRGRLSEARFQLEELAFTCRDYGAGIEFNSNRLEQLEERLAEIDNAKRKYGGSVDQILEYYESIVSEVALLENREVEVSRLSAEIESVREIYLQRAAELSDKRHRDALELAEAVSRELRDLAMKNTVFRVHLWPLEDEVTEKGSDGAEFLISPNVGEEPRPLARIASGGELSRVMLALKSVLKNDDQAKTLVFDEVDAGIGGRTARSLGEKLSRLSQNHQIFCVTHLPQVAAFARQHFYVQKRRRSGRTVISISSLAPDARIEELSRMLAGDAVTQTTRQQAQELLHSSE